MNQIEKASFTNQSRSDLENHSTENDAIRYLSIIQSRY